MRRGSLIAKNKEAFFNPEVVHNCCQDIISNQKSVRSDLEVLVEEFNKFESFVSELSPGDQKDLKEKAVAIQGAVDTMHKKVIAIKTTVETLLPLAKKLKIQALG